jgi:hypothetical protein
VVNLFGSFEFRMGCQQVSGPLGRWPLPSVAAAEGAVRSLFLTRGYHLRPAHVGGRLRGFCDFAGPGDESVLAVCDGNSAWIEEAWRHVYFDLFEQVKKFLLVYFLFPALDRLAWALP